MTPGSSRGAVPPTGPPHVLVLSRNYPNQAIPGLGIWVDRLVQVSRAFCEPEVVAPVAWVPPLIPLPDASRHRAIPRRRDSAGVPVHHPRVPTLPGYVLHAQAARLAWPFVRREADALHRTAPFRLIHAHFIFPDGVMAAALGRRYGIPVLTTEHAPWLPWLRDYPSVRRQVENALPRIQVVTAVSESQRRQIAGIIGDRTRTEVLPNVVDDAFVAPGPGEGWDPDQIVFVGAVRRVKGLDVLVRALALLAHTHPRLRLLVVGHPFFRQYSRDEAEVRTLITELGLAARVHFTGHAPPGETARIMRSSALLVLPSRRETFGTVAVEALASGTPVVATRCGGPEDILTPDVAIFAPPDDPPALARAIAEGLDSRASRDRSQLRQYAISRFGRAAVGARLQTLYEELLRGSPGSGRPAA